MRDWLNSILGQDGGRVAQFALALVAVVLLILLLAWVIRRLQPGARLVAATGGKTKRRLGVLEASDVDARRRLVLVRRDDVEHLIMIGGPNDLLIESRILRGGQTAHRPNVQQMPRPAAVETERFTAPALGNAPTGPSAPPTGFPLPQAPIPQIEQPLVAQPRAAMPAPPPSWPSADDEPELPVIAPVAATPSFAPPPFVPPTSRPQMNPIAPTPPTPAMAADPRRPSLSDLLSAATAAKAVDRRDLPQPMTAPPPMPRMKPPQPDLEEDDRDMPTQIVSHRLPQAIAAQQAPALPQAPVFQQAPAFQQAPVTATPAEPFVEPPASRETEVATQIERALADLNPLATPAEPSVRAEPKIETVQQPQLLQPRRPVLEPVSAPLTAPATRPVPVAAAPVMPQIPPRPTPPTRPALAERPAAFERPDLPERLTLPERPASPERTALPERPIAAERPALPERPAFAERAPIPARPSLPERVEQQVQPEPKTDDRPPIVRNAPFTPTLVVEPTTAPRPITVPVPRPPASIASEPAAPASFEAPVAQPKQRTDELEEEMAKLLSELGGSSSR